MSDPHLNPVDARVIDNAVEAMAAGELDRACTSMLIVLGTEAIRIRTALVELGDQIEVAGLSEWMRTGRP